MKDEPESSTPRPVARFQFGLFHLLAVVTIAAMTLSVLRVIRLPAEFWVVFGVYLTLYAFMRGPMVLLNLSKLWQRREQLLLERQQLERQLVEMLKARGEAKRAEMLGEDRPSENSSGKNSSSDELIE